MPDGVSNSQILSAIMELKQDMGGVKEAATNAHNYAANVSTKADRIEKKIDDHTADQELHAPGVERRQAAGLREWIAPIVAAIVGGGFVAGFEFLLQHGGAK